MRCRRFALALALWLVFCVVAPSSAGPLQDDAKARRAAVMQRLGPDALAIFWSAPERVYSTDVNYEYRQESNLLYLTAVDQEETILVLIPGSEGPKEFLFVREADARREHWSGHSLTPPEASAQSGIATVLTTREFEPFVSGIFSRRRSGATADYSRYIQALAENRARLAVLADSQPDLSAPPGTAAQFAAKLRERFFGFTIQDAAPVLAELRQIKTPYEQDVLRTSVAISNDAHRAGMRAAAPGKYEYEVEAAIEEAYLRKGAMSWGYPSIVGSGPNATILHYLKSQRKMEPGDLLLVDAAANYQGQTGDITRTYPVSGSYSREQRDIYEMVYAAQQAGETAAKVGADVREIQDACDAVVRKGLLRLGLITDATGPQYKVWATHSVTHWIGMDVHDVSIPRPLAAGMAFVIEPGVYIREAALADLPRTAANLAFVEKVRPVVQKYKNIGVRIEDSYLLGSSGLERLSAGVPRTVEEVEQFLKKDR